MTLQLYPRQLSSNALTIDDGGQPFFIPKTFNYMLIGDHFVNIDIPSWFKKKHNETLTRANNNALLTIKRLAE